MSRETAHRRTWRDAEAAVRAVARYPGDQRTLLLLAHLPLVPAAVMARLAGLRGPESVDRGLRRLAQAGLVSYLRPAVQPGPAPRLWHLTDLGLATVACDQRVDPLSLARCNRLRQDDLLASLPGLPQLLATYELLGAFAAARPGPPDLLAWERPWRRRYWSPTAKAPVKVTLPAYAALAWGAGASDALLLPDRGTVPLSVYRPLLSHLLGLRRVRPSDVPALAIATTDSGRAAAWWELLEAVRRARGEAPLRASVVTWHDLRADPTVLAHGVCSAEEPARLIRYVYVPGLRPHRLASPLPRLVGDAPLTPTALAGTSARLGAVTLRLAPAERALLDLIARHPFLPAASLALLLDCPVAQLARRCRRLGADGLLRLLEPGEAGAAGEGMALAEVTIDGLRVVAAQQGLTPAVAVRANGLAGGGPEQPFGARPSLVRQLAHTLGADAVVVRLAATAKERAATGSDDALLAWQSAAACARGHLRPDGYGIYRHHGRLHEFFLEYDRGTMSARDQRRKFTAYYDVWTRGRLLRDGRCFPTVLAVAIDDDAEARLERAARAAAVGRGPTLPLLLTSEERIDAADNSDGPLGPIWREAGAAFEDRRRWPLGRFHS